MFCFNSYRGGALFSLFSEVSALFPDDPIVTSSQFLQPCLAAGEFLHQVEYIQNLGALPSHLLNAPIFGRSSGIWELVTTLLYFQRVLPPFLVIFSGFLYFQDHRAANLVCTIFCSPVCFNCSHYGFYFGGLRQTPPLP